MRLRRFAWAAALLGVGAIATGATLAATATQAPAGEIDLAWTLSTAPGPGFSELECPHPETQLRNDPGIQLGGEPSIRFQERPGDRWLDGTVRCLVADYTSGETKGDDYYYGIALYLPGGVVDGGNLVWELHHPSSLYRRVRCGVAPYALHIEHDARGVQGLFLRIAGGNCSPRTGWSIWKPNIPVPGLARIPTGRWIEVIVHIRFAELPTGVVELWSRVLGSPWPSRPSIALRGLRTLPRCDVCRVHGAHLYTELGLYSGRRSTTVLSAVNVGGYWRGTSLAVVRQSLPSY